MNTATAHKPRFQFALMSLMSFRMCLTVSFCPSCGFLVFLYPGFQNTMYFLEFN
jgi:hypothetical protein